MKKNLIIFIKNPVLGKVKTRLAEAVGDQQALEIYIALLEKTREEALQVKAKRFLYYSDRVQRDEWLENDFKKKPQSKGDLGQKMQAAFQHVMEQQQKKCIIIGSDCYDLSADIIERAFFLLDDSDVVIGPANDGGYYLLGMKSFHPALFMNVEWSTEKVLDQTLAHAKNLNLRVALLEELIDLDTFDDLLKSGFPKERIEHVRKN